MVVQVEAAAEQVLLVLLGAATMPVVLVVVQPFKAQLLEIRLEAVAAQVEVTVTVAVLIPKLVIWLNLVVAVEARLMVQLVRTHHKEPGAFTEQGEAEEVVVKAVMVRLVAHGAFMTTQLTEVLEVAALVAAQEPKAQTILSVVEMEAVAAAEAQVQP
jgi:hypothetical protein